MKVKLSVVIISYNEANNIARCIDSVRDVADEVLVVDSFSTDQTQQICLDKGARVVQHAFDGHVEQKNWAMQQASYDHVLSLDADEALSEPLRNAIIEVKHHWLVDGYTMNRLTNYCGKWIKHCGWYPDSKLRLWNRTKGKWGGMNPHDKFLMNKGAKTQHIQGDLLHYSFYTVEQHRKQIDYFSDIASQSLFKSGKKARWHQLVIHPLAKFLKGYVVKLGFLDGKYGFTICRLSAYSNYLKYNKLRNLYSSSSTP
jgi:glycosyltransferase involved in cell wall biosynthesis